MLTDSLRNPTGLAAPSTTWILTTLVFLLAVGLFACAPDPQPSAAPELISSGTEFTCMLQADGSPVCWGAGAPRNERARFDFGQSTPPTDESFIAISSGAYHTCALRQNGTPVCWGDDRMSQTTLPAGEKFTTISSGAAHICALREDGTPVCWGNIKADQTTPPEGEKFTTISSGGGHTCALRRDGSAVCWLSDFTTRAVALTIGLATPPEGERFTAISSGSTHTCGLRADNSPVCWGLFEGMSGHAVACESAAASHTTCRFVDGIGPPLSCGLGTSDSPPCLEDSNSRQ